MLLRQRVRNLVAANKSLLIFFGLMLCFRSAVADWMYVPSGSMNPTIVEGDRILVDKEAYGLRIPFTTKRLTQGSDPQRGDIVIFASPEDGMTLVKRVIGLPGALKAAEYEALGVARISYGPLPQRVTLTTLQDLATDLYADGVIPEGTRALN